MVLDEEEKNATWQFAHTGQLASGGRHSAMLASRIYSGGTADSLDPCTTSCGGGFLILHCEVRALCLSSKACRISMLRCRLNMSRKLYIAQRLYSTHGEANQFCQFDRTLRRIQHLRCLQPVVALRNSRSSLGGFGLGAGPAFAGDAAQEIRQPEL